LRSEFRLPVLALPGLSPDSLGNYLASLGLLRVLCRRWPSTRIAWRDEVLQVVGGPLTLDELLDEMVRIAGTQCDSDVSKREWTQYDKAWSAAQKSSTKAKSGVPLALWQAEAQESQLQFFAAHAVPHARVSFNPLLGSGGNAGRRDFASGWKQAVDALAAAPKAAKGRRKMQAETSAGSSAPLDERRDALQAFLLARPVTWMVEKLAAGSWFSEATKLYNSGQSAAREGQISPWAMVLACEGLAFIAGGASRRLGSRSARTVGAFPFVTQPVAPETAGAAGRILGEIWAPLWTRPMSLAETGTLFSRGRAELRGRGALTPAAFATAIRKRGIDGGVSEFRRFTLGRTTSDKTFEPRFEASFSLDTGAGAMNAAFTALERVTALIEQRSFPRDRKVGQRWRFEGLRGPIEAALLDFAAEPSSSEAGIALLDAIVSALDRIDRNRSFREGKVRWEPLPLEWLPSLFGDEQPSVEARLALSLVSAFSVTHPFATYRFGVDWKYGPIYANYTHTERPPARWVWGPGDLARVLGAVLVRRLLDQASDAGKPQRARAPLPATVAQVRLWFAGDLDESLFSAWLSRLALFDWRKVPQEVRALIGQEPQIPRADGELALLGLMQPLVDQRALVIQDLSPDDLLSDATGARTTEAARSLVTLIRAGNLDAALRLASSRYAMAGARLASFDATFCSRAGFVLDAGPKEEKPMSEAKKLTPADVLKGESPLVLTATLEPIVGDRFQPAGFPEIGYVIYKAPRKDGSTENVCIVDSAASMANHLEAVCQRGAHDLDLAEELGGMPYIRCVTNTKEGKEPTENREVVVTSLTEGHRIASSYFIEGVVLIGDAKATKKNKDGKDEPLTLERDLIAKFGIVLPGSSKAHPPPDKWWSVFRTIFEVDPNSLVHGVLFPQWQIKIPRALTAHIEAFGAGRVDRSGVKFDRLGKTTSGQPIFAVDDATAEAIRATFVLDVSLIRSFGRKKGENTVGLSEEQQEFLVALALWKIQKLLASPFRFRSGCHLRCTSLKNGDGEVAIEVDIKHAIANASFPKQPITDVFWPREELYREGQAGNGEAADAKEEEANGETE
jgi:CRISPR-associated protein Csx17